MIDAFNKLGQRESAHKQRGRGIQHLTYTYDDYGKTLTSTGSVYNPFKYTGEYTDAESGFVYLRTRYYDPESQQFLTVDPALAWTEQAYAYVGGSPINFRDPSGRCEGAMMEACMALGEEAGEAADAALSAVLGAAAFVIGIALGTYPADTGPSTSIPVGYNSDPIPTSGGVTSAGPLTVVIGASIVAGGATCTLSRVVPPTTVQASQRNEIVDEVKKIGQETGQSYAQILDKLRADANRIADKKERNARILKVKQAGKFLGLVNKDKRQEQR